MALELIENSAVPGTEPPIATLSAALSTAAALSTGTIKVTSPVALAGLKPAGQFRTRIDAEILLVTGGQTTTTWNVVRGVEGPAPTAHAVNAGVFHDLTVGALQSLAIGYGQLPDGVSTTAKASTVTTGGTWKPDLSNGQRVFKVKSNAPLTIGTPINLPAGTSTLEITVEVEGKEPITHGLVSSWLWGGEPKAILSGPTSVNRYQYISDDHVTWRGVGEEGLPSDVLRATLGAAGQFLGSDGTKPAYLNLPAAGLSKAEIEAVVAAGIAALSILTGGHPMAYGNAPSGAGEIPVTTSASAASYVTFLNALLEHGGLAALSVHAPINTSTTLVEDTFNPVIKAGSTQTLPTGAFFEPPGRMVVVRNESGGAIKVKGKLNPAVPAEVTVPEVANGDTILYLATGTTEAVENVWIAVPLGRTLAQLEAIINEKLAPGAWAAMTSLGGKIEQVTGFNAHGARLEQGGAKVGVRGLLQVKAGEELKTGERLCTLPTGKRPVGVTVRLTIGAVQFDVDEGGKVNLHSANLPAGTQIGLDGYGLPIT